MTRHRAGEDDPNRSAAARSSHASTAAERGRRETRPTRRIALAALVLAVLAIGFGAWRAIVPPGSPCQSTAWNVAPAAGDLPAGWTLSGTQYDIDRKLMTLLGPAPSAQTGTQPVAYATITCFAQDAADAVTRSADAASAGGQQVTDRTDLGEQGFASVGSSGAAFIEFRRGNVVASIAASGGTTADEANAVASAVDRAMGGAGAGPSGSDGGAASSAATASAAAVASSSPAAPELESALPSKVGATTLTIQSATGTTILSTDQGSRAIAAALRAEGKTAVDLRVAQAYDASGSVDLSILAISVTGMQPDALRLLVLDSWLLASGAGVKTDSVTLAGHTFTRIDYGDQGTLDYMLASTDRVVIIETADANLASAAAAALP